MLAEEGRGFGTQTTKGNQCSAGAEATVEVVFLSDFFMGKVDTLLLDKEELILVDEM